MALLHKEQPLERATLERLYVQEKRSMQEIAESLDCSLNKIVYWMDKYGLRRRDRSQSSYIKQNPLGDPFQIKELTTSQERDLMMLAVGLYIGEGTKKSDQVRFTNSNPQVICAFLRFLREICGVDERKIIAWLNVYADVDVESVLSYWQEITGLTRKQFTKPFVQKRRGGSYVGTSRYGTLTLIVGNRKLADFIKEWCTRELERFS